MNWTKLTLSAGAGVLGGFLLQKQLEKYQNISPEKALKKVKQLVQTNHKVDGSWIHMQSEVFERFGIQYEVYRGGITITKNDTVEHYSFLVDADTGTILELAPDDES